MRNGLISDLPISEAQFARMLRSAPAEVTHFAASLPDDTRALLALFCYARAHLRDTGVIIARACDRASLVREGGQAGTSLFEQARSGPDMASLPTLRRPAVSLWSPAQAGRPVAAYAEGEGVR